jgi:polyisoprenoid-binding protein YceI
MTMKKLLLAALMISTTPVLYAQKYMSRTGKISFNSTAPKSPEKIEAINNEVATVFDSKTGDLIFQVPVKSFKFERALMQEHFNENYLESDKFPKSEFKGKVSVTPDITAGKDGTYNTTAMGKITIHGVTKDVTMPGTIEIKGKTVRLKAKFTVLLKDYDVNIPAVVADKINKECTITLDTELKGL